MICTDTHASTCARTDMHAHTRTICRCSEARTDLCVAEWREQAPAVMRPDRTDRLVAVPARALLRVVLARVMLRVFRVCHRTGLRMRLHALFTLGALRARAVDRKSVV